MNKMKDKTALQWLVEQMINQGYFDCNKPLTFTNLDHLQHQAMQMEREQIMDAWNSCGESIMTEEFDNAEQYYNETYGGQNER
jgi:uncharacterized protein YvpB